MLDDVDQSLSIDRTIPVCLATESHECVKRVFFIRRALELLLVRNNLLKLVQGYLACVFW